MAWLLRGWPSGRAYSHSCFAEDDERFHDVNYIAGGRSCQSLCLDNIVDCCRNRDFASDYVRLLGARRGIPVCIPAYACKCHDTVVSGKLDADDFATESRCK